MDEQLYETEICGFREHFVEVHWGEYIFYENIQIVSGHASALSIPAHVHTPDFHTYTQPRVDTDTS